MQADLVSEFYKSIFQPEDITCDKWADQNRIIPKGESPEHGKWRTDRVPFMREVMECLSPLSPVQEIDFMKGTQIAGSESSFNAIGHWIDTEPGNILFVQPTEDMVSKTAKTRIASLINNTESLSLKINIDRGSDKRNTIKEKFFPGGFLHAMHAGSGSGSRSFSYRYLIQDELDEYPPDLGGNGDPVMVYKRRTNTYRQNRKIYRNSSPKRKETSLIYREFLLGDQRLFYVPCLACGHLAPITWSRIKFINNNPQSVYCLCENCDHHIDESEKNEFLPSGVWTPHAKCSPIRRSYQLPGLYSPYGWYSWEEAVSDFLESKGDATKIQAFVNTVLAEPYEEKKQTLKTEDLQHRCELYPANIPDEVCELTVAVDVQKDRFELEVMGWGEGEESFSIEFKRITATPLDGISEFEKLTPYLERQYRNQHGQIFTPTIALIDSGYATDEVYKYCAKKPFKRIPIKGSSNARDPILTWPRRMYKDKGVYLTFVGTDTAKDVVFHRLAMTMEAGKGESGNGLMHWPLNSADGSNQYDDQYFKQMGNEHAVTSWRKGVRVVVYEKTSPSAANESLDLKVYSLAAIRLLQENFGVFLKKPETDPNLRQDAEQDDSDLLPQAEAADGLLF